MAGEGKSFKNQNLILESRKNLSVSGVEEVDGFDDGYVRMHTCMGPLLIRGQSLRIESLSVETGELSVTGEITEIVYEESAAHTGWFKRLLG